MEAFALKPRKPFIGLTAAAVGGIILAEWIPMSVLPLLIAALAIGAGLWFQRLRWACWIFMGVIFALLHITRHKENPARQFALGLPAQGHPVTLDAIVWSEPDAFADGRGQTRATFWARVEKIDPTAPVVDRLCLVRWHGDAPGYGDRVRIAGSAQVVEGPRNPGEFDSARWLSRQGIHFQVATNAPSDCTIVGHGAGQSLRQFAIGTRAWIKQRLDYGLPEDPATSSLISSMVLGMRGETPADLKELFQKTGTLHLFAVSGLNVAMLGMIAWQILKALRLGRKHAALVIVPFLAFYAIVVGMSASCVRATVMAAFVLLAPLFEREPVPLNSLAAAAFAILAWDTNELFNPGFQLSFFLVLAILAMAVPIRRRLEKPALPDDFIPRRLWTSRQRLRVALGRGIAANIGVSLAAWVGSLCFMAGYFHLVSPIAIFANLIAVPIAFCILALGLFSLIGGLVFGALALIANHANWICAKTLIATVDLFAQFPRGHLYVEWPSLQPAPACEVVALDAGEGAAIHLRTGGRDWLIDAGHHRGYPRTLLPYLRSRGVNRLDGMLLTHGDSAHIGGAPGLLDDFLPAWIGETATLDRSPTRRALHADFAARNLGRRFFVRSDVIPLAPGADLRVLYPPADWSRNLSDDKALVFRLECAGRRVLFTSDVGFSVEQWLLANEPDLHADVLIKGWAERDLSGTTDFIAAVQPAAIVCAAPNFGSGAGRFAKWIELFHQRGIVVLPQSELGAIRLRIETDGSISVAPWRNSPVARLATPFANERDKSAVPAPGNAVRNPSPDNPAPPAIRSARNPSRG
jgi:competence protein ComEC